uniref:Uncharacterized protein n=1 Tax=Pithovirus LCPAC304 TaxID=2506594 RepID=A0A481Z7I3_9VIRU|nr:MAG: hypothetical protein LCPAC304_00430 [Pithovirus LCPAC304]
MEKSIVDILVGLASALLQPKPFLADCPHCEKQGKKTILKYRGSVKCMCYGSREALDNWEIDERIEQLKRYAVAGLSGTSSKKGETCYHYTFMACDECIHPEHIPAFTHFPDGWEMTVFKSKHYGPYEEEINFDAMH